MTDSVIYFGAGCFWCAEATFSRLRGVTEVRSGYAGGIVANPSYEQVTSDRTGHAEVVRVGYDPSVITFTDLLAVFFTIHDPTTLNRQGYDIGTRYRSAIFYTSESERRQAEAFMAQLSAAGTFHNRLVTELKPFDSFYPADPSHYSYYELNRDNPYCRIIIDPKLDKLKTSFRHLLK